MKPPTVFLGEMTSPEVEAFLREHQTVIVPTGSTEQHGPHGPLLTDVLVPNEVARRVAPQVGARRRAADQLRPVVSARRVHRRRPHPDPDVHGPHRGPVRLARVDRLPADRLPQRPLRQHVRDRLRLRERGRPPAGGHPRVPGQLLGRHDGRARRPSTSARRPACTRTVPRPRPCWRSTRGSWTWTAANAEMPPFPEVTSPAPVHTAFFFSAPGLGPPRHPLGDVGRRARVDRRVRRALPRGRDRGDDPDARRHRADVRGDAAALRTAAAPARDARSARPGDPGPGAHHPARPEVGSSSTRSARWPTAIRPAIGDPEQGQRVTARGRDRGRQRHPGADEVADRRVERDHRSGQRRRPGERRRARRRPPPRGRRSGPGRRPSRRARSRR